MVERRARVGLGENCHKELLEYHTKQPFKQAFLSSGIHAAFLADLKNLKKKVAREQTAFCGRSQQYPYLDLVPEYVKRSDFVDAGPTFRGLRGLRGKRMPYMNLKGLRGKRML
ncbi:hypothetical protein NECAME_10683 [Necator americanus]|uniref:Uncharacterized protein n=1 Tax=Necator americanus TaxID=51031 RepID=W2TAB7_NECAM|nr:hypothetical protein NECAME_10683 [Necator americanus]ETN77952.1 hypothetical protein NECAME_10683 [Necator americanus]